MGSHAAMARALAEQLGLPDEVRAALGGSYEQWDGRGWPGELEGEEVPIAARVAQLAEFVEVAHRVGGVRGGAGSWPASAAGGSSTRCWPTSCAPTPTRSSTVSTRSGPGTR